MGGGGMGGPPGGGPPSGQQAPIDIRPAAAIVPVSMRLKGVVTLAGASKALKDGKVTSEQADVSGIYATRGSQLTIDGVDITTTGAAALVSDSHDYGINSALLIDSGSKVLMTGGHITSTGQGANGAYVSGDGAYLRLTDTSLATAGTGAHGLEVRAGAALEAHAVAVSTQSDHAPALSAAAQARPVRIDGGSFTTQGPSSPAFALFTDLEATGVTASAGRSDGLVLTGDHRVAFTASTLSGGNYGVMIYDAPVVAASSMSGPISGGPTGGPPGGGRPGEGGADKPKGAGQRNNMRPVTDMMAPPPDHGPDSPGLTWTGGKLSSYRAVFYVTNIRTHIRLDSVEISSRTGILLKAVAGQWGELGRNGGDAVLDARRQILTGDFITDVISHIAVNLSEGSHLTGRATRNTDITLDPTSTWTLTADSSVGKLMADPSRIDSQGHTLSYDTYRNPALNNQTIALPGGGQLVSSGL